MSPTWKLWSEGNTTYAVQQRVGRDGADRNICKRKGRITSPQIR